MQREAYKAWFVGLLFNTVAGLYTLYQLRQKARSVDRKDGDGVVESKKVERYGQPFRSRNLLCRGCEC